VLNRYLETFIVVHIVSYLIVSKNTAFFDISRYLCFCYSCVTANL